MRQPLFALILSIVSLANAAITEVAPGHSSIRCLGRYIPGKTTRELQWSWSGSGASISFVGTSCSVKLLAPGAIYRVQVDGKETSSLDLTNNNDTLHVLANGLTAGPHEVELRLRTEANNSASRFFGFRIDGTPGAAPVAPSRRIEFYGNSITCGYGILDNDANHAFSTKTEDESVTFAAQAADALGAERHTVCWSGRGVIQNYGQDTIQPTLPELYRQVVPSDTLNLWDFSLWIPQVVVIDLGTNDFSTVAPNPTKFRNTYAAFIDSLHARYPQARFVLVDGPMLSDSYPPGLNALTTVKQHLDAVVAAVKSRGITAVHLSLTPQEEARGYGADWHPNLAQATLNGQELTALLRDMMDWRTSSVVPSKAVSFHPRFVHTRNGTGLSVRGGLPIHAKVLDAQGRLLWSRTLLDDSIIALPLSETSRWLRLESSQGIQVVPLEREWH